jgi:class 3 adenylate cyclase
MSSRVFGGFADREDEARFLAAEREAMFPYLRLFGGLLFVDVIGHLLLGLFDFPPAFRTQLFRSGVALIVLLAAYWGATQLKNYCRYPVIDFAFVTLFALIQMEFNSVINIAVDTDLDALTQASVGLNRMLIGVFAALALSGRMELLLGWLLVWTIAFFSALVGQEAQSITRQFESLAFLSTVAGVVFVHWAPNRAHRSSFLLRQSLDQERARNQEMLYNVLPSTVVDKLKTGAVVADSYSDVTVIFIDIVGSSQLAKRVSPGHLIEILNAFFGLADRCAEAHGVEKVKTVGDAYLAVAGGNVPAQNSAEAAIGFARAVITGLPTLSNEVGVAIQVRAGVHSGPVVGGVIGRTRMAYDHWGDTMNVAARIEGTARPNGIAISETAYLRARSKPLFDAGEAIPLKGVGDITVYRLRDDVIAPPAVPAVAA